MDTKKYAFTFFMLIIVVLISSCTNTNYGNQLNGNVVSDESYLIESSNVEIPGGLSEDDSKVQIYFFWGEGCPFCIRQKEFHDELKEMFPDQIQIMDFETYSSAENRDFLMKIADAYPMNPRGVPITFIGDEFYSGFAVESIGNQMIRDIEDCIENGCESPFQKIS